ncbi:MAG: hypothetical protein JWO76_3239 [Nocardioides sp.]|nr:hypothetical protein [Nocardioides sp.]
MTDDHELERVLREGLDRRAQDVDTDAPVAERARESVRRRRRGRVAAGVAALAVAAVAVTGVVVDRSSQPRKEGGTQVTDRRSGAPAAQQWRTEYWHDVQVDVPADWGWGTAPDLLSRGGRDFPNLCGGPGAKVTAAGEELVNADPDLPYVGRPIALSDLCLGGDVLTHPRAPYVWLGADLEPGTVELAGGYVQETRVVNGSTVTVGARDADLRARILDSATAGKTCRSELDKVPMPKESSGPEKSSGLNPDSLTVCAYRRTDDGGPLGTGYDLTYGQVVDAAGGRAFLHAADAAPRVAGCGVSFAPSELVLLRSEGPGPWGDSFREYRVDLDCKQVVDPAGNTLNLTPALEGPWSLGGIQVVPDYFIGELG